MESNSKNANVIDLTKVLKDYSGKWVILSKDDKQVLKSGNSLDEIIDYAELGVIMLVPDYRYSYSPYCIF